MKVLLLSAVFATMIVGCAGATTVDMSGGMSSSQVMEFI